MFASSCSDEQGCISRVRLRAALAERRAPRRTPLEDGAWPPAPTLAHQSVKIQPVLRTRRCKRIRVLLGGREFEVRCSTPKRAGAERVKGTIRWLFLPALSIPCLRRDEVSAGSKEQKQERRASEQQITQDQVYDAAKRQSEEALGEPASWPEEAPRGRVGSAVDQRGGRYSQGGNRQVSASERQRSDQDLAPALVDSQQQYCCAWPQSYGQTFEGVLGGAAATRHSKTAATISRASAAFRSNQRRKHRCYHQGKANDSGVSAFGTES